MARAPKQMLKKLYKEFANEINHLDITDAFKDRSSKALFKFFSDEVPLLQTKIVNVSNSLRTKQQQQEAPKEYDFLRIDSIYRIEGIGHQLFMLDEGINKKLGIKVGHVFPEDTYYLRNSFQNSVGMDKFCKMFVWNNNVLKMHPGYFVTSDSLEVAGVRHSKSLNRRYNELQKSADPIGYPLLHLFRHDRNWKRYELRNGTDLVQSAMIKSTIDTAKRIHLYSFMEWLNLKLMTFNNPMISFEERLLLIDSVPFIMRSVIAQVLSIMDIYRNYKNPIVFPAHGIWDFYIYDENPGAVELPRTLPDLDLLFFSGAEEGRRRPTATATPAIYKSQNVGVRVFLLDCGRGVLLDNRARLNPTTLFKADSWVKKRGEMSSSSSSSSTTIELYESRSFEIKKLHNLQYISYRRNYLMIYPKFIVSSKDRSQIPEMKTEAKAKAKSYESNDIEFFSEIMKSYYEDISMTRLNGVIEEHIFIFLMESLIACQSYAKHLTLRDNLFIPILPGLVNADGSIFRFSDFVNPEEIIVRARFFKEIFLRWLFR